LVALRPKAWLWLRRVQVAKDIRSAYVHFIYCNLTRHASSGKNFSFNEVVSISSGNVNRPSMSEIGPPSPTGPQPLPNPRTSNIFQFGEHMQGPNSRAILPSYDWASTQTVHISPRQPIFAEGEPKQWIYRIEKGSVCLYKAFPNNKRRVFDFGFEGEVVGLDARNQYALSAETTSAAVMQRVKVATLYERAAMDRDFAFELYRAVSAELDSLRRLLTMLSHTDARARVALFLLALTHRKSGDDPHLLRLPMKRTDIADFLGITPETLSRVLTGLSQQGLIVIVRHSEITIRDMFALQQVAGSSSKTSS
jgi:CRP/FNR family transcriptional regulator, anaerobic regulatory protein